MDIYNSPPAKSSWLKRVRTWFRNIFLLSTVVFVLSTVFQKMIAGFLIESSYQAYANLMAVVFLLGFFSLFLWLVLLIPKLFSKPLYRGYIGIAFFVIWAIFTLSIGLSIVFNNNIQNALDPPAYRIFGGVMVLFFFGGSLSFFAWIFLLGNKLARRIGLVLLSLFLLFFFLFFTVVRPNRIVGESMEPVLPNGSFVLGDAIRYVFVSPERGEIVVFISPVDNYKERSVARIVGLPGQYISILKEQVYINDELLTEPYLSISTKTQPSGIIDENKTLIPEGMYAVMGDNRDNSMDSRHYGFVKRSSIKNRIYAIYWPSEDAGFIKY